jgi:peptidoglycan hydrolase-like protein with peptidoglycan-binding domain
VSATEAPTIEAAPELGLRRRRTRRRVGAAAVAAAGIAAAVLAVTNPFESSGASSSSSLDNGSATSLATVERRSLSSQTQVDATLGYADASTVSEPAGTPPATVLQAEQTAATARAQLQTARAALSVDRQALEAVRARLTADRLRESVDCGGANAAQAAAAASSDGSGGGGNAGACATAAQAVATEEQTLAADAAKVAADEQAVASAATTLAGAEKSLAAARASATVYGQTSSYTHLPSVGKVIRRDRTLFAVDGLPVILLYGRVPAWRAFVGGTSPGPDVAELNANLRTLGYGQAPSGDSFTAATAAAIKAFQAAHGLPQTGELLLGAVVFAPRPVRVTRVNPTRGATVQPGPVLSVTSTRRQVEIALDATQQATVKVGDPATITLPDNRTTPGRVSFVGTVATAASDSGNSGGSTQPPTIEVHVTPSDPATTGRLDRAPVSVAITTATVDHALVVPVNALLALASGGYAVEEVASDGTHRLVPVELGLFDDSEGLVQVTGTGLRPGRRIVVPAQ